jgi:Transcriptional regulators
MSFSPVKPVKVYQHIIIQIRQMIYDGKLKKGDKLPSERDFVALFQVSRSSIREAVSALELLGIVESRHGEGIFVSEDPLSKRVVEPLSMLFMLERNSEGQLHDVRKMLEEECAYQAALAAKPADIAAMTECIRDFEQSTEDKLANMHIDQAYHFTIVKASGNTLLYYLYSAISDVIDNHISKMRTKIIKESQNIGILFSQHKRIYAAICEHNQDEAKAAMADHMKFVSTYLTKMG